MRNRDFPGRPKPDSNRLRGLPDRLHSFCDKGQDRNCRGLPALQGDPHLIEGALLNLVSNAIKYSARGSEVKLRAESRETELCWKYGIRGPRFHRRSYYVSSNRFIGEVNRKKQRGGWGLGLAFVKRIAEQHGGKAEAWSESGSGTSFRIHLPVTRFS